MMMPLAQVRLCLDCDCLTDEVFCPKCDRDSTVPLAAWLQPLQAAPAGRTGRTARRRAGRWLIVVQHHQQELFRTLHHALADTEVEVIYERRAGDRRRRTRPTAPLTDRRRRTDRRRTRASAVVYEGSEAQSVAEKQPAGSRERHPAPV